MMTKRRAHPAHEHEVVVKYRNETRYSRGFDPLHRDMLGDMCISCDRNKEGDSRDPYIQVLLYVFGLPLKKL